MHSVKSSNSAVSKVAKDTKVKNQKPYYVEISLSLRVDSTLEYEEIQEKFGVDGTDVEVQLISGNDKIKAETLEVWENEWEEWE